MKFIDVFKDGMNIDSPQFEVAYNQNPKEAGGKSTATIEFKIAYEAPDPKDITAADMAAVKTLAYQWLRDQNKLYLPVTGGVVGSLGMTLKSISARPVAGTDIWEISCKYDDARDSSGADQELQLKNFQFSTQGRTSHITTSIATVDQRDVWGGNGWDFQQGIGWNDGEFSGVDVKRPNLTFQRDLWILNANMDFTLIRSLAEFTGSVNADWFYGFEPGMVLFTGVSQGQRATLNIGDSKVLYWNISLSFETSPNAWIGFGNSQIYKRGWDYIWYLQNKTVLSSDYGKIVARTPVQATVEQVYEYREFIPYFGFGYTDSLTDGEGFFNG